jgi:hypothetical protein
MCSATASGRSSGMQWPQTTSCPSAVSRRVRVPSFARANDSDLPVCSFLFCRSPRSGDAVPIPLGPLGNLEPHFAHRHSHPIMHGVGRRLHPRPHPMGRRSILIGSHVRVFSAHRLPAPLTPPHLYSEALHFWLRLFRHVGDRCLFGAFIPQFAPTARPLGDRHRHCDRRFCPPNWLGLDGE